DLVLLHPSADGSDLGHTGDRVELIPDEPVLRGPQLAQGMHRPLDGLPEDVADAGPVRTERRHNVVGQELGDEAHSLQHTRSSEIEIAVVLEYHVDYREAEGRLRPHHPHAGEALEG